METLVIDNIPGNTIGIEYKHKTEILKLHNIGKIIIYEIDKTPIGEIRFTLVDK